MPIPPNPSANPLPSYASRTNVTARPVGFSDALRTIWRWLRGRDALTLKEQIRRAKLIEQLSAELEAEAQRANIAKGKQL